jgi:TPR repeat protein
MARRLLIAAVVFVISNVVCTSVFSQNPPTAQTNLPAKCDGTPAPGASEQDVRGLESTRARIARGDTDAMLALGSAYLNGQGVKRNVDCTIQLWEIAANAGNVEAMSVLGTAYHGLVNFPTKLLASAPVAGESRHAW